MSTTRLDHDQAKKATLGGAVLAALLASSCCIGPLVLAALGIGGAGAFAVLGAYRPYILGVTAALLAGGFYLTYRKPRAASAATAVAGATAATADACGCEASSPKAGKAGKIGLWIATALVVVFAAAPNLLACLADRGERGAPLAVKETPAALPASGASPVAPTSQEVRIQVEGMDCEACATHIRTALKKVGGLHELKLDLKGHAVDVGYEPAPGRLQAYVAAINDLGYEASLPSAKPETAAKGTP